MNRHPGDTAKPEGEATVRRRPPHLKSFVAAPCYCSLADLLFFFVYSAYHHMTAGCLFQGTCQETCAGTLGLPT